ncbi:hemerythrin domain-containing protein [Actinomadura barringtoniae]|uniref:Hemerythrin domain-containing protein n=1 Tax=Actinomadura barringtoniae TaxID=1427535 RepID=A0A939PRF2_9ACTN|nr:hemerythrin domain-containing protein [Actinomadura barringtoniae]MBO2454878.1 hemerythrin domain-containing protein [Actinomadura barringtoniae]
MRNDEVLTVRPRRPDDPQVDLRLYVFAHRAMRRGAHDLAGLAARIQSGELQMTDERARALETYVDLFTFDVLHHHRYEDRIGFPVVRASALGAVDIEPFTADHESIGPMLEALGSAAHRLADAPGDAEALKTLAEESARLRDLLDEHLAEEEREIFPVITQYVSVEDYDRWEQAVMKAYPKRNLWFVMPWSAAANPPEEVAPAVSMTPFVYRASLRLFRRRYARLHRTLFD